MDFVPALVKPKGEWENAYWFCYQNNNLMVEKHDGTMSIPLLQSLENKGIEPSRTQFIGMKGVIPCFSAEIPINQAWPEDCQFISLIELFPEVKESFYRAAVYAHQIVAWDKNHQYCGVCGTQTNYLEGERAKKCPQCGHIVFPRISPAIMVAVLKNNKILLAKNKKFPQGFYSVLAGFLDPGEQLEECIAREVKEEVGITVKNLRYFGSQPWPFPDSLMIAFIADYADGEIKVDKNEIIEADWFDGDNMPNCPSGKLSVAGRLIDWYRKEFAQTITG